MAVIFKIISFPPFKNIEFRPAITLSQSRYRLVVCLKKSSDFKCCSSLTIEPNYYDILLLPISLNSHFPMNRAM